MLDKIMDKISSVVGKKVYIVQFKEGIPFYELVQYLDKTVRLRLSDMEGELAKANAKLEQADKEKSKDAKKDEKELTKEILEFQAQQQKEKNDSMIALRFNRFNGKRWKQMNYKELPTFFLRSNRGYEKLAGVLLFNTPGGYTAYFPLLMNKKQDLFMFKKSVGSFGDFFYRDMGIVTQLLSGKADTNFDLDRDTKPTYIPQIHHLESGEKIKIVDLTEQERLEFENKISDLKSRLSTTYNELEKAERMNANKDLVMMEQHVDKTVSSELAANALATVSQLSPILSSLAANVSGSLAQQAALTVNQGVQEANAYSFANAFASESKALEAQMSKDVPADQRTKLMRDINEIANTLNSMKGGAPVAAPKEPVA